MQKRIVLSLLLLTLVIPEAVALGQDLDPYGIRALRVVIEERSRGLYSGTADKYLHRGGDRVAVALFKIYTLDELSNPKALETILPLLKQSFEQPEFIVAPDDRNPQLTDLLLGLVSTRLRDPSIKKQVDSTKRDISQRLADFRGGSR